MYKFPGIDLAVNKISRGLLLVLHIPIDLIEMFVSYYPGRLGYQLRYIYWKRRLKFLGKNVLIDVGAFFKDPAFISIDDHTWIDRNVIIMAGNPTEGRIIFEKENQDFPLRKGEVYIGKNTHIAQNCSLSGLGGLYIGNNCGIAAYSAIYSFSHHYRNLIDRTDTHQYSFTPLARLDQQAMIRGPVFIDDYCALGLNTILMPGISLKRGTWVASGLVLNSSPEEHSLILKDDKGAIKSLSSLTIKT